MVGNNETTAQRLIREQLDDIRRLRLAGLSMQAIGDRLGICRMTVSNRICKYGLDAPVGQLERVGLELLAAFRETNRRLAATDLTTVDHARLCVLQVRQSAALLKLSAENSNLEEKTMGDRYSEARARIDNMNTEELRNEIRRLAGLELKTLEPASGGELVRHADDVSGAQSLPDTSDGGAASADST